MSYARTAAFVLLLAAVAPDCKRGGKGGTTPTPVKTHAADGPFGYRLNPGHTGAIDGTLQAPLQRRWIGPTVGRASYPIVTAKAVFVIQEGPPLTLRSFDLDSGKPLWPDVAVDGGDTTTTTAWLSYADGLLFANTDSGLVSAIDSDSGKIVWTTSVKANQGGNQFLWPATTFGGKIYVPGHGLTGNLSAMNAATGLFNWTTTQGNSAAAPAAGGGFAFSTFGCGSVTAFDLLSGVRSWTTEGSCTASGPSFVAFDEGVIYGGVTSGSASNGSRLDPTGQVLGSVLSKAPIAIHSGHFVTLSPTEPHTMKSIDPSSSSGGWLDTDADDVNGPAIIVNGQVFSGAADGTVRAVDEATGGTLWSDNVRTGLSLVQGVGVWGDLGTNGDVLVVPTQDSIFVYESGPTGGTTPDPSYKTYCNSMNTAFHIVGDESRITAFGDSLFDGAMLFEGDESLTSGSAVEVAATTDQTPTDYQTITVSTTDTNEPRWDIAFRTRIANQPLQQQTYALADERSTYDDVSLGAVSMKVTRLDIQPAIACDDGNGQFELTTLTSDGSGIVALKGNFLYHCNREAASVRGCFSYHR